MRLCEKVSENGQMGGYTILEVSALPRVLLPLSVLLMCNTLCRVHGAVQLVQYSCNAAISFSDSY